MQCQSEMDPALPLACHSCGVDKGRVEVRGGTLGGKKCESYTATAIARLMSLKEEPAFTSWRTFLVPSVARRLTTTWFTCTHTQVVVGGGGGGGGGGGEHRQVLLVHCLLGSHLAIQQTAHGCSLVVVALQLTETAVFLCNHTQLGACLKGANHAVMATSIQQTLAL